MKKYHVKALLEKAFDTFSERVALDLGAQQRSFADLAVRARDYARSFQEVKDLHFVVCECSDVERYIAVLCACILAGRTVVPFSTQKFPFDDLAQQLPGFLFVNKEGQLSAHSGGSHVHREEDDIYCLFTSGTTGKPKGIIVSDENLHAYVTGISEAIPEYRSARSISAVFSPLFDLFYHDFLLAFAHGASLQLPSPRERMTMASYVAKRPIDIWFSTPTLAANILAGARHLPAGSSIAGRLPLSLFCGERLGAGLAKSWATTMTSEIINVYGPTETTIACTTERLDVSALDPDADVSIGRAFGDNRTEISAHGTLLVRGAQVARYLHSGPVDFFDTKDLASERDGKLYFNGRADGQLKIKGLRIEREELERVACSVPGLSYAKIQAILEEGLVVGFKVLAVADPAVSAAQVADAYRRRYGAALIPSGIEFVEEFETSVSGKARV